MASKPARRHFPVLTIAFLACIVFAHGCERYEVQQPVNTPPAMPTNPSPASDSSMVISDLTPLLAWGGGIDSDNDAVTFELWMGPFEPLDLIATTDAPSFQLPNEARLQGNSLVLWRVVARDARGAATAGPTWVFRTAADPNQPPTSIESPVPADAATDVVVDVLLQWFGGDDPEGGPVSYVARIDTLADFSSPALQRDSTLSEPRFRPAMLDTTTQYFWQVSASDTLGAETTGPLWSFTTGQGEMQENRPPNPVGAPIPADAAGSVEVTLGSFRWSGGNDPDGDPVAYDIYLGTGGTLELLGSSSQKRLTLSEPLEFQTNYNWRVDARDDHGHLTEGPGWSFTVEVNDPPTPLEAPTPFDGAVGQARDVLLTWDGGEDPERLDLDYEVYLAPAPGPLTLLTTTSRQDAESDALGLLSFGTTYLWRVDAIDSGGVRTTGPTWAFATIANGAPSVPSDPQPANGQVAVGPNTSFTWSGVVDPEGDALTFEVRLSTTSPPAVLDTVQISNYTPAEQLEYVTTYYWQIVASDAFGNVTPGPIWTFMTAESRAPAAACEPITPPHLSVGVGSSTTLTWSCGVDPDGDPVTFDVLMDTSSPATTVIASGLTGRLFSVSGLPPHRQYFWRVRATDGLTAPVMSPEWSFTTFNTAPSVPAEPSPANLATLVDIEADLSWGASIDADGDLVTYRVYFDELTPPITELGVTQGLTFALPTLEYDTTYFWQILAEDAFGGAAAGPVWQFTSDEPPNVPPDPPSAPNPAPGATDVGLEIVLGWTGTDPNGDPLTYDVYFGTVNPPPFLFNSANNTYDPPGELDLLTTHYWRIIVRDDENAVATGPIWSFTTGIGDNQPPSVPSLPSPSSGSVGIPIDEILAWLPSTDPDSDPITYDVYFGTTNPPPLVSADQSIAVHDPGSDLEYVTTYFWKVVADDGIAGEAEGPMWSFTTGLNQPPTAPSGPLPPDGFGIVQVNVGASWVPSTDPDGDPVTYDVYFGTSTPPPLASADQAAAFFDPPGDMPYATPHYWRVVAKDDRGNETSGPEWSFTTMANQPPSAPTGPFPFDGATGMPVDVVLGWTPPIDPESDPLTYDVYLGKGSQPELVASGLTSASYAPAAELDYGSMYFWRVVANDDWGNSTSSAEWTFSTVANLPPSAPAGPSPSNLHPAVSVAAMVSAAQGIDPEGDPLTYDMYFGTVNPPPLVTADGPAPNYDPPGNMAYSTTHYWQAVAKDDHGNTASQGVWSFTTVANGAPTQPSGPFPANGAVGVDLFTTLTWVASTDPEGDPVTYDVYFGTSVAPPLVWSNQTSNSYFPGFLAFGTQYYWRIVAKDDQGNSTTSLTWSFTSVSP